MKQNPIQEVVKIIRKQKISDKYFKLTLESARIASGAIPGQFVEIKVSDGPIPLLRRPFGIHRVSGKTFEILFEIVGPGTQLLSQREPGQHLDIIGPLGNGFIYRSPLTTPVCPAGRHHSPILIAGGMGVAPLVFLAQALKKRKTLVLIGAKTKNQVTCEKEFKDFGCDVKIATDDGSQGFKGYVSDLLKHLLAARNQRQAAIYACGPKPMLKEISIVAKQHKILTQFSLEEHMACGIGACLGCVVKTKTGFKRVCIDGPVFNADEITWEG